MKTVTKTLYEYDDLSDDAKAKARDWFREDGFDYEWWYGVYDDAKQIATILGIEIEHIWFRGFWSQGDGACFVGSYQYAKDSVRKLKEYAPEDTKLHAIAESLAKLQRRYFYNLQAKIHKVDNYYEHEHTVNLEYVETPDFPNLSVKAEDADALLDILRDFMRWIYKTLETEYEYLSSDEQVAETIRINDYTFDKDGHREN